MIELLHEIGGPATAATTGGRYFGYVIGGALKSLGRSGLADLIERTCAHAQRFAEEFREAGYEILNDVVINQVLVAFGDECVCL